MKKSKLALLTLSLGALLAGCQTAPGNNYRADVYRAQQVNQMQDVLAVQIVALQPAQVVVPAANYSGAITTAAAVLGALAGVAIGQHGDRAIAGGVAGGLLGSAAASAATENGGTTTVPGVQVVFRLPNGQLKQSSQVGQLCEFKLGEAILVMTDASSARVQPNNPLGCGQPAGTPATP